MFDLLFAAAAVATIASFLLDLYLIIRQKQENSKGKKKKSQR